MSTQAEVPSQNPFEDCSAERVFSEISAQIETPQVRTLWLRLETELKRQGVGGATTYLNAEFTHMKENLNRELSAAKNY